MTTALLPFDIFVHEELPTLLSSKRTLSVSLQNKRTELQHAREAAVVQIRRSVCALEDPLQVANRISRYQRQVIILSDAIAATLCSQRSRMTPAFQKLVLFAAKMLQDIYEELRTRFYIDFDKDLPLPLLYKSAAVAGLSERTRLLRRHLETARVDTALLQCCFSPLDRCVGEDIRTSATQLEYFTALLNELDWLLKETATDKIEEKLFWTLCHFNFNSHRFICYCRELIKKQLEQQDTLQAKLHKLREYLRIARQFNIKPGVALRTDRNGLRHQLMDWLMDEISYYEAELAPLAVTSATRPDEKLCLKLSVAQLALFVRLMVEAGIIASANLSAVARVFTRVFSSVKNEHISAESFRIKYYDPDRGTMEAVRNLLTIMLRNSKQLFPLLLWRLII